MTPPELIVGLPDAADPVEVGAKAANLARLMALSAPVPPGFVVTGAAWRLFVGQTALQPRIDALRADPAASSPEGLQAAAARIAALFRDEHLPRAVGDGLDRAWEDLSSRPAIVRSSAVGEDSDAASFAGQLDSIPGVGDARALRVALKAVWASQWSARALAYQEARRTRLRGMGVIVQRQVAAVLSGVLFTRAPRSDSHMLLEYCCGTGEALVSGMINPGRVRIARSTLRFVREAAPERGTPHATPFLTDVQVASIARLGLQIEGAFGVPQDIEWALDDRGRVWIVQARPITARARPITLPRAAHATGGVLWSNANVNENFPGPICPLLYSIASAGYYHYFRNLGRAFGISRERLAAMEQPLRHIIGVHGGRMYYNLTSIHAVLRSAPFGDLLAASFDDFVGAGDTPAIPAAAPFAEAARGRLSQAAEVAVIAAKTAWQYLFLTRRVERFERTVSAFADRTHPQGLSGRSASDLLADLRGFMEIRCSRWNDAALADAGSMVCYGVLKRLLARGLPEGDGDAVHNTLLKALPDLVSGIPPLKLWDLSRRIRADADLNRLFATGTAAGILDALASDSRFADFNAALRRYLDEWGFRCSAELMLTVPSFQEQPAPVIDLLTSYAALDAPSPADQLKRQRAERLAETARVLRVLRSRRLTRRLPGLSMSPIVRIVLRWTQRSIQLRERARLKQALLYSRLRRIALALGERLSEGGRLDRPDDVFFLTFDEIDALACGHAMFPDHVRPLVALRRQAHDTLCDLRPPDAMWLASGEYLPHVPGSRQRESVASAPPASLAGVGACGGSSTGRAAILTDVTQSHRIARGDVLVTSQTDPGWGPIFPLIAGLVVERGGMLSHGAIIAREFGIPSVVGVRDATRLIPDGCRITVDGDRGLVHLAAERPTC